LETFPKTISWLGMEKQNATHIHQSKEMYNNTKYTKKTKARFSPMTSSMET